MNLKTLLAAVRKKRIPFYVIGNEEVEITGLASHSGRVLPGYLFVAKGGTFSAGVEFIPEALSKGAVCVLRESEDPHLKTLSITQIVCKDVRKAEALLAAAFFSFPSEKLAVIGITGTSGKTSSTFLIRHLLEKSGKQTSLLGGNEWIIGKESLEATLTTADVITNHELLFQMVQAGSECCVMEVSSHGLDQGRVREIDFEAALFTNLTEEHLDYHKSMEEYAFAKRKLFESLKEEAFAIINIDDPRAELFLKATKAHVMTFSIEKEADLQAEAIVFSCKGLEFKAKTKDKEIAVRSSLIGKFNVYNLLGAICVGLQFGISLEKCARDLQEFKGVPGRMQPVANDLGISIFIDHAHKPAALHSALETLRQIALHKVIVVFGCGGDRDPYKREKMGKIASELADVVIITSDNPRTENAEKIAAAIVKGIVPNSSFTVELDRKKAIALSLQMAKQGDIVLIAGKGHERTQIFADRLIDFEDKKVTEEILATLEKEGV